MNQAPFEWPQSYLDEEFAESSNLVSDERVLNIANNLYGYAVICYDSWEKRIIKEEEDEIRTRESTKIKAILQLNKIGISQKRNKRFESNRRSMLDRGNFERVLRFGG